MATWSPSVAKSDIEALQLSAYDLLQARGLIEVGEEFLSQPVDLLADRLVIPLVGLRCADISARRQDVVVLADFLQVRRVAKAWDVLVLKVCFAGRGGATPGMVGAGDLGDVLSG